MHPAPVGAQPGILAPFDDPSAPRAHLARGLGLIRLRIEVRGLLVFAFALGDLSLGRLLPIFRQDVLGPFLETIGPLPDELFLAVLGHHDHRPPMGQPSTGLLPGILSLPPSRPRATDVPAPKMQQIRDDFPLRPCRGQRDDHRQPEAAEMRVVVFITPRQPDAVCDTHNRHQPGWITDPLSDVCALFPQVADYIGQLCGIF